MKSLTTRQTALTLFLLALVVYNFPLVYNLLHKPFFTWAPGQDLASTSLLPLVLLERGDFTLNEYREFFTRNWRDPYFVAEVNGQIVSRSPVMAAVLAVPFYGVPLATGWITHPPQRWLVYPWSAFFAAKSAAAFITALAVVMFFFCARELTDLKTSAALAVVFAFGTSVWSTASQGLWQQTPSILFQVIALWFILRGYRKGAAAVAPAAFFFSAATISRPNNGIIALLFTFYVLLIHRCALWGWSAWAIPPAAFFLAYNAIYNGSPFVFGYQDGVLQYFTGPQLEGILGSLISPSRGLLVYSPFFVFALFGAWRALQEPARAFYLFAAMVFAFGILSLSVLRGWDGGWGYGTRMLVDVLPYATLLLIPAFQRLRGVARFAFWGMVAYAVILQSFGLWDYGVRWHWHWENWAYNVWDVAQSEPLFYLKQYAAMAQRFWGVYGIR